MNNKFGRDGRYAGERYRDPRDDRYHEHDFGEDYGARGPEQEFETSLPYRQPAGASWNWGRHGRPQQGYGYAQVADRQGYAPSPYVPRGYGSPNERRGGYAGRGPKGYTRTDDRIREDVCDRLSWNDEVDATDIAVRVSNGEVILEGSVQTRHMKRLATDIAEEVPGVSDVHNTVRVTKPVLTQLKEKLTGEARDEHYANTGTKTSGAVSPSSGRNGVT